MIVTVTPSPAIDWTVAVDSFALDAVNRITTSTREASGKGLNVSWALHRAGIATTAVFPGGGQNGAFMDASLTEAGLPYVRVETSREVRTNITLVSPGHSTKINEPGVMFDSAHVEEFVDRVIETANGATDVLICGSLPPSMSTVQLYDLVRVLRGTGVRVMVDTSGEPLSKAATAGADLIKPNVHELADLVSREIRTFNGVVSASREVVSLGVGSVLASLGPDGAMYVDARQALLATARNIPFVNSVGAGDALLSGFVAVQDEPAVRLRNAVHWSSSAVAHDSTLFPLRPEFDERITVEEFAGGDTVLSEPSLPLGPSPSWRSAQSGS